MQDALKYCETSLCSQSTRKISIVSIIIMKYCHNETFWNISQLKYWIFSKWESLWDWNIYVPWWNILICFFWSIVKYCWAVGQVLQILGKFVQYSSSSKPITGSMKYNYHCKTLSLWQLSMWNISIVSTAIVKYFLCIVKYFHSILLTE
jgi:hypothetical protein